MKKNLKAFFIFIGIIFIFFLFYIIQPSTSSERKPHILAMIPQTGRVGGMGTHLKKGMELYLKEHPDFPYTVDFHDTESNPQKALSIYQQNVLLNKPDIIISSQTPSTKAILPQAKQDGIFVFVTICNVLNVIDGQTNAQRFTDVSINTVEPVAEYVNKHYSKVAVLYGENEMSASFLEFFEKLLNKNIHLEKFVYSDANQGIRETVYKALSFKPEIIYVIGSGFSYINTIKSIRSQNPDMKIITDSCFADPNVREALGKDGYGIPFTGTEVSLDATDNKKSETFIQNYQNAYQEKPFVTAAYAYDMMSVIDNLIKQNEPINQQSFAKLKQFDGVSGTIQFPGKGESSVKMILLKQNEKGEIIRYK